MFVEDSIDCSERIPPRQTGWLTWLAAILVLLFAFCYFVVKPLVENAVQGAGTVLIGLVVAAAQAAKVPYDIACHRVESSQAVKAIVGEPIVCVPFEKSEWLDSASRDQLEFQFDFTGPRGNGRAHVVVAASDTAFEIKSLAVTGPTGEVTLVPEP
jgi:hypothetical protein